MKRMLIDANHEEETRVAIVDRKQILEFDYASANKKQIKGNIYLAKVTRVEPSLQAAFVEYGGGRQGFLPFSEIHPDYYQIPVSDRQKLMEEVARELQEDADDEDAEFEERQTRGPRRKRRVRSRRRRSPDDAENADEAQSANNNTSANNAEENANVTAKTDTKPNASEESQDHPDTKYAKKEEPSVQSDVVVSDEKEEKKPARKPAKAKKADATEKEEGEVKKPKVRRTLRGRVKARKQEDTPEVKPSDSADENAPKNTAENVAENAAELEQPAPKEPAASDTSAGSDKESFKINSPIATNLGAALFSEDKPFDATKQDEPSDDIFDDEDEDDILEAEDVEDEEGIETLDSEEEAVLPKRKKRVPFFKRYKIQEVIKRGQVVLVQATKEERGNKGASVTTYLSLAGRYCVLMPNSPRDGGVSRKISDGETRKRLKEVMGQLTLAQGMSVIIRTAGIDRSRTEIRRDFDYLVKLWNQIRDGTLSANAPALIYEENNLIKRAIRDLYTSDIDEVLVEGKEGFEEVREFMQMLMPSHTSRVKEYQDDMPLYYAHGIEDQLASMHDPVVKMKSGGYLVINPTEALISIDVNSGRSTGERNIEETALKTNVEAAHEVARQLRLRDLSGLIVIDFIDMMDSRNRRSVERNLKDALRSDRAKIQVGRISPFGLMEMSRQRLRPSIGETMHTTCPSCNGRGLVHAPESLALHIVRTLEKEAVSGRWGEFKLRVPQQIALYLLNSNRTLLTQIEQQYEVNVVVEIDASLSFSDFVIEKVKVSSAPSTAEDKTVSKPKSSEEEGERRPRKSRGGRNRRGKRDDDASANSSSDSQNDKASNNAANAADDHESDTAAKSGASSRGRGRSNSNKEAKKADPAEDKPIVKPEASQPAGSAPGKAAKSEAALPEFTKRAAVEKKPDNVVPIKSAEPQAEQAPPPDTSRPKDAPPRKGWWQQIIELD